MAAQQDKKTGGKKGKYTKVQDMSERKKKRLEWWHKKQDLDAADAGEGPNESEKGDIEVAQPKESSPKKFSNERKYKKTEQPAKSDEGLKRGFKRKITEKIETVETNPAPTTTDSTSKKLKLNELGNTYENSEWGAEPETEQAPQTVEDVLRIGKPPPQKKIKKQYFVLFVGNLPYDVTEADVAHFFLQAGELKDVRVLTSSGDGKPKGCAYVEFYTPKAHKLALMMHHSKFKERQINVEFTSAGRKGEKRDQRIKEKNKKGERFKMNSSLNIRDNRPVQKGKIKVKGKQNKLI